MKIVKQIRINSPATRVWELAGPGYTDIDRWSSTVAHSESRGEEGRVCATSPVAGRTCQSDAGQVHETLVLYDAGSRQLAYEVVAKSMPGFVRKAVNTWTVQPVATDSATLEMSLEMDLAPPFNVLMVPLLKLKMGGMLMQNLRDFKHFLETSEPSPAKAKALAKQKSARPAARSTID
ncbi:MAG: SRPBCC family protein [Planctomycetota bacterium]